MFTGKSYDKIFADNKFRNITISDSQNGLVRFSYIQVKVHVAERNAYPYEYPAGDVSCNRNN